MFRSGAFIIAALVGSMEARVSSIAASLQPGAGGAATATAMAGIEGEACSGDEYGRYQAIVCKTEEACGCSDTVCELDWCAEYVHTWKKTFGACNLKGCSGGKPLKD